MHMWMWSGFDLGHFMFPGLDVSTPPAFAATWIILFLVAMLFEGSKVYLARVQRHAQKMLCAHRSDERRTLLNERVGTAADGMEANTSRNAPTHLPRWAALRLRLLVTCHQSFVFLLHNIVGYLLMLAVMLYNVYLIFAVVLGMMLGYFLFGTKLTRLQMKCFFTRRNVICTPECDDTAENTTPPLLDSANSSESDFLHCSTRTCIQPSHYFRASQSGEGTSTCYYGAKACPSKVARARKQAHCRHQSEKEDSPGVEDAQLLSTERQGCCKKQEPPPQDACCSKKSVEVVVHEARCEGEAEREREREDSPQITCCHSAKATPSDSQEQIVNDL